VLFRSIGGGKFVVMNYLQQTFSTELKYVYDVANLFIYDYTNNTIEQALIGTGVNTYSGAPVSYNPNFYGETLGINNYNNDYCYGGLGVRVSPYNGQIFWKKSLVDQVYFSESHTESGVAQIWGLAAQVNNSVSVDQAIGHVIRIWNIQSNGSLQQSKRTIFDMYSNFNYIKYDSYYNRVILLPLAFFTSQLYAINPKNLAGVHGVNDNGTDVKNNNSTSTIVGLSISGALNGKQTTVYGVTVTPTDITYSVRPGVINAGFNGIFPHKYAVGEVVKITGIVSSPVDQLNFPNSDTGPNVYATITAVTPTTFTIANTYGATATYTSGGTVTDAVWASVLMQSNFGATATDNKGNIIIIGTTTSAGASGLPGYNNPGSTFALKYGANDLFTQRENPKVTATGVTSTICSATPDGLFRGGANNGNGIYASYGQLNNAFLIHVPAQNVYWVMGTKNPSCTTSNITNAVYNPGTQTIRYTINNSFSVGKVVTIAGVLPNTYNLSRVKITAADATGFEISYTGTAPAVFDPLTPISSNVKLSADFVLKVLDDTTLATVATIDLSFINGLMDLWSNPFTFRPRFQYSESTDEIYLYSNNPSEPVYVFSTITNTLVKTSTFKRMLSPYPIVASGTTSNLFTLENINNIPYFSSYVSTNSPTRFWFRLDLGDRTYQNNVHNLLNVSTVDYSTAPTIDSYDLYNLSNMSNTFGQWKEITDTTWATIPSTISTTLGATIEFTSFILDKPLVAIRNLTQSTTYSVSNALNSIKVYTILADSINLFNGDLLEFEFTNPDNPSCPFINQSTITF
jgi:hypothetical protein